MAKIILSLLLIASLAGIITSVSSTALPGNMLYPFKVNVTEKVGALLAFTDIEKAEFSEDIAETRLGELRAMLQNGTLTSTAEVKLVNAFDIETTEVAARVHTLAAKGDLGDALHIAQSFQTSVASIVAQLPGNSSITTHLQATLSSISALSGSISTTTKK